MNEAIPFIIAGAVVILVIFEALKYAKAHPSNPIVQAAEAKLPAQVQQALAPVIVPPAAPVLTGEHLVQVVQALAPTPAAPVAPAAPVPSVAPALGVGTTTPGGPTGTNYNPDLYPVPTQYQPWLAAGRPEKDVFGRALDVQGALIDNGGAKPVNLADQSPYPGPWVADIPNGATVNSPKFTLEPGDYQLMRTEMFYPTCVQGSIPGTTAVGTNETDRFHVAAPLETCVTVTASPGNPHSTATRVSANIRKL